MNFFNEKNSFLMEFNFIGPLGNWLVLVYRNYDLQSKNIKKSEKAYLSSQLKSKITQGFIKCLVLLVVILYRISRFLLYILISSA